MLAATERGDQQLVKTLIKGFVDSTGATNYLQLLRVPTSERIPALAKQNREYIHKIVAAQIEFTMKYFNLKNPMTIEQIFLLADEIINESEYDNLSIQDVYLFLVKIATGKMGKIYERLDIPTFMEMFDKHRYERHETVIEFMYEEHVQNKSMGPTERESDNQDREKELMRSAIGEYLKDMVKDGKNLE